MFLQCASGHTYRLVPNISHFHSLIFKHYRDAICSFRKTNQFIPTFALLSYAFWQPKVNDPQASKTRSQSTATHLNHSATGANPAIIDQAEDCLLRGSSALGHSRTNLQPMNALNFGSRESAVALLPQIKQLSGDQIASYASELPFASAAILLPNRVT